jgi:hypothetical protein
MANNDVIKGVVGPQGPAGPSPSGAGNLVLATPNGSAGTATLRALVLADLPSLIIGAGTVTNFTAGTLSPIFTTAVANPTTTPSLTFALNTQVANSVFAGPTSGGATGPTFRSLVFADLPAIPTGTVLWNQLGNASGNLTLANANFTTEFDQTSAVAWLWKNTTVATVSTVNASPVLSIAANYWTGAASAVDSWTIGSSLAAGANGLSTLTVAHSGSSAASTIALNAGTGGSVALGTGTGVSSLTGTLFALNVLATNATIYSVSIRGANQTLQFGSVAYARWSSTTGENGAADLSLSRSAVGVLAIGNGAQGNTTGNLSFNRVSLSGADFAGQATVTAGGTTKAVTFAANYTGTGQPVVVITPTSDPLALGVPVGYWVTYQGGVGAWTGFTVNIQTALAGDVTFNYIVVGNR